MKCYATRMKKLRKCIIGVAQSPMSQHAEQVGKVLPGQHRRRPVTGIISQQDTILLTNSGIDCNSKTVRIVEIPLSCGISIAECVDGKDGINLAGT